MAVAESKVLGAESVASAIQRLVADGDHLAALLMAREGLALAVAKSIPDNVVLRRSSYAALAEVLETTIFSAGRSVYRMSVSPDGQFLATAAYEGGNGIALWTTELRSEPIWSAGGSAGFVNVIFSPDGGEIAAMSRKGTLSIYGVRDGKQLPLPTMDSVDRTDDNYFQTFHGLAYAPDGQLAATNFGRGNIMLIDRNLSQSRRITLPADGIARSLDYSRDGTLLAIGGESGAIYIYDRANDEFSSILNMHEDEVSAVRFSPNGHWLASSSEDGSIVLIPVTERDNNEQRQKLKLGRSIWNIRWSRDSERIAIAGSDGWAYVAAVNDMTVVFKYETGSNNIGDVAFHSNADLLLTADSEGFIRTLAMNRSSGLQPRTSSVRFWTAPRTPVESRPLSKSDRRVRCVSRQESDTQLPNIAGRPKDNSNSSLCAQQRSRNGKTLATLDLRGLLSIYVSEGSEFEHLFGISLQNMQVAALSISDDGLEVAVHNGVEDILIWPVVKAASDLIELIERRLPSGLNGELIRQLLSDEDRKLLGRFIADTTAKADEE